MQSCLHKYFVTGIVKLGVALSATSASSAEEAARFTTTATTAAQPLPQADAVMPIARLEQAERDPAAGKPIDANWQVASFLVGLTKLVDATESPELLAFASHTAQRFHYAFHGEARSATAGTAAPRGGASGDYGVAVRSRDG